MSRPDCSDIYPPWPDDPPLQDIAGRCRITFPMGSIFNRLSRLKTTTFSINYSPEYKTFIMHQAVGERSHPLHFMRKRELAERKREALWWHVTSSLDLSKSSVVRSWCRRRLRGAFTECLKERGFDEHGRLCNVAKLREHKGFELLSGQDANLSIDGSVRLHIAPALVTAKYADVRQETSRVLDILLEKLQDDMELSRLSASRHTKAIPTSKAPSRSKATASQASPNYRSQEARLHSKISKTYPSKSNTIRKMQSREPITRIRRV